MGDSLLSLVKEYVVDVWEIRKHILYGDDSSPGPSLHLGIWLGFNGKAIVSFMNLRLIIMVCRCV